MPRISSLFLIALLAAGLAAPAPARAQTADVCAARAAEQPSWPFRQLTGFSLALSERHADGALDDARFQAAMEELQAANALLARNQIADACAAIERLRVKYDLPNP